MDFFTGGSVFMDYGFIISMDSLFDGTRCREFIGKQVMQCYFSESVTMKKQIHLHLGWPEGEYIFSNFFLVLGELFL